MLINNENPAQGAHIKFVSYTGRYPNIQYGGDIQDATQTFNSL